MLYFALKFLHIIGASVLLGTGAGIAFFMLVAHRTGNAARLSLRARTDDTDNIVAVCGELRRHGETRSNLTRRRQGFSSFYTYGKAAGTIDRYWPTAVWRGHEVPRWDIY